MPPRTRITREHIIQAALGLVRSEGMDKLNARAIAGVLGCSTQPIFSNYETMEEVKQEVIAEAKKIYHSYIKEGMEDPANPPYKASGLAYIRFAQEERELFKLLFMRDRSGERIHEEREEIKDLIRLIARNTGLNEDDAYLFHIEMWIYVHGIAVMIATSYLEWDWDRIGILLTDMYEGLKARYKEEY